ncbi:hypothetical protein SAMN05216570_0962 [Dyella sp. OK004]|uniref:hypothetical protein n=1 Tax=Dyella sp. OK004 TaxID=1855292 RepID=UPI0008E458F5|nr:hypothetical protein [Dyella sp. OK004]SFR94297.1 hypothetical protein SAMN05216570_0962 [Dyella sp. OK004]
MAVTSRTFAPDPRTLSRAVEDLRAPYQALQMAATGIASSLHTGSADESGVYHLLQAVAGQLDIAITKLESLTTPH